MLLKRALHTATVAIALAFTSASFASEASTSELKALALTQTPVPSISTMPRQLNAETLSRVGLEQVTDGKAIKIKIRDAELLNTHQFSGQGDDGSHHLMLPMDALQNWVSGSGS
jgi:hypothetical protein